MVNMYFKHDKLLNAIEQGFATLKKSASSRLKLCMKFCEGIQRIKNHSEVKFSNNLDTFKEMTILSAAATRDWLTWEEEKASPFVYARTGLVASDYRVYN